VSRYLRRVLGRTAGQPLGALQAAKPRRWSSQLADPFAAADPAAGAASPVPLGTAAPGRSPELDARPAVPPARSRIGPGAVTDGGDALEARTRRARRGFELDPPADPLPAPPGGRRGADIERRATQPLAEPVSSARIPVAGRAEPARARPPGPPAVPSAPEPPRAMPGPTTRPASVSEGRDELSRVVMPLPPTSRREPAAATEPARRAPGAPATGGDPHRATPAIVAPPTGHAAPPSAASRPEIVIGRISVLVESARPPVAAPRTVVRQVTAPRNADGGGLAHSFGRFGLGQL